MLSVLARPARVDCWRRGYTRSDSNRICLRGGKLSACNSCTLLRFGRIPVCHLKNSSQTLDFNLGPSPLMFFANSLLHRLPSHLYQSGIRHCNQSYTFLSKSFEHSIVLFKLTLESLFVLLFIALDVTRFFYLNSTCPYSQDTLCACWNRDLSCGNCTCTCCRAYLDLEIPLAARVLAALPSYSAFRKGSGWGFTQIWAAATLLASVVDATRCNGGGRGRWSPRGMGMADWILTGLDCRRMNIGWQGVRLLLLVSASVCIGRMNNQGGCHSDASCLRWRILHLHLLHNLPSPW